MYLGRELTCNITLLKHQLLPICDGLWRNPYGISNEDKIVGCAQLHTLQKVVIRAWNGYRSPFCQVLQQCTWISGVEDAYIAVCEGFTLNGGEKWNNKWQIRHAAPCGVYTMQREQDWILVDLSDQENEQKAQVERQDDESDFFSWSNIRVYIGYIYIYIAILRQSQSKILIIWLHY